MSGLALIRNPSEWQVYRQSMAEQASLDPSMISWGSDPVEYPCMVASRQISDTRFLSCYIYKHDARQLLQAHGELPSAPAGSSDLSFQKQQTAFNSHTTALLMAIIEELESVSVIKRDRFERVLAKALARVDQVHAEGSSQLRHTLAEQMTLGKLKRE